MTDLSLLEVRRVAKDLTAKYPELGSRIDKAVGIIGARDVEHVAGAVWKVGSWKERDCTYFVSLDAVAPGTLCQCIDSDGALDSNGAKRFAGRAPEGRCGHWIAAAIVATLTGKMTKAPAPAPVEKPRTQEYRELVLPPAKDSQPAISAQALEDEANERSARAFDRLVSSSPKPELRAMAGGRS